MSSRPNQLPHVPALLAGAPTKRFELVRPDSGARGESQEGSEYFTGAGRCCAACGNI